MRKIHAGFSLLKRKLLFLNKLYELKECRQIRHDITGKIHIFYRISDAGFKKEKLPNVNNENCLKNAAAVFPIDKTEWHVICDNCSDATLAMVCRYIPAEKCRKVSVGNGAGTFTLAFTDALGLAEEDAAYFLENDYLHTDDALEVLRDGFRTGADFVTLYDHPDKYQPSQPIYYYMKHHTNVMLPMCQDRCRQEL